MNADSQINIAISFKLSMHACPLFALPLFLLMPLVGCDDSGTRVKSEVSSPATKQSDVKASPQVLLPSTLRRQLRANDNASFERVGNDIVKAVLFQSGVKSIEPLRGLPLRALDLGMTDVQDLSPLEGMPLTNLILENTAVDDIQVLEGMSLQVLQLQNTKVTDLSVLHGMPIRELNLMNVAIADLACVQDLPLQTLWIPGTQVADISALKDKRLVSLDVQRTAVASIEGLSGMKTLRRLNIADTKVTDLGPLAELSLERITLTPGSIETGMDVLKNMRSLSQIRTTMEGPPQSADDFWKKFDAGVWAKPAKSSESNTRSPEADVLPDNTPESTETSNSRQNE